MQYKQGIVNRKNREIGKNAINSHSEFKMDNKKVIYNDVFAFHNLKLSFPIEKTGSGFFSGNIEKDGVPVSMIVKLYLAGTKDLVQETVSMEHNGYFEFSYIADDAVYDMYAIDPSGKYETKVKENITCLKYYYNIVNFDVVSVSKAPPHISRPVRFTLLARGTENKPTYTFKNKPDWLTVNNDTGLCYGTPKKYLKSLPITIIVHDGDKEYEFNRTVEFSDTRMNIDFNNKTTDTYNSFTLTETTATTSFVDFPKGGKAITIKDGYLTYTAKDSQFKDLFNGSFSLEITFKLNTVPNTKGVIFSSDKVGKGYFELGYNNSQFYFNINGTTQTVLSMPLITFETNSWMVLTIVKDGSIIYGFYNGVLLYQWSNSLENRINNNFYIGGNPTINGSNTDITVRRVIFTKNYPEQDDTHTTTYSFVNEEIAFPKVSFLQYNDKESDYVAPTRTGTASFESNHSYYCNAVDNPTHYYKLPNRSTNHDLGSGNWTLYFDAYLGRNNTISPNTTSSSGSHGVLFSGNVTPSDFSLYFSTNFYYRQINPYVYLNGTSFILPVNTKRLYKLGFLRRHFIKIVRKKGYIYTFMDGILLNKSAVPTTKTFNFLGGTATSPQIILGGNSKWSTNGRNFVDGSSSGFILIKNKADIDEYDIYETEVTKYHNIKMVNGFISADDYFTDKYIVNGTIQPNTRYLHETKTHNILINDIYNFNDIITIRLTGTTVSSSITQSLLTLKNSSGNYIKVFANETGICVDISTTNLYGVTSNNIPKGEDGEYDIILSSDGKNINVYVDGVIIINYDINNETLLFDKLILGSDDEAVIKTDSSSTITFFQRCDEIYFKDDLTPLLNIEYQNKVDYKFLAHNMINNVATNKNLYTNIALPRNGAYGIICNELVPTTVTPLGDWTFEVKCTIKVASNSLAQQIYTSCSHSSYHSELYIELQAKHTVMVRITSNEDNRNGINDYDTQMNRYFCYSTKTYEIGDSFHVAVCRTGDYVKVFIDGEMLMNTKIIGLVSFYDYAPKNYQYKGGWMSYNSSNYDFKHTMNYSRILNGIALYNEPFDATPKIANHPSADLTTFPTTSSLPLRFKMTKK